MLSKLAPHQIQQPEAIYMDIGELTFHYPISEGHMISHDMVLVIKDHS